jgi:hypothetical protein
VNPCPKRKFLHNKFSIRIPEANPRRENPLQIKSLELTALITEGDSGPNEDKEDIPF